MANDVREPKQAEQDWESGITRERLDGTPLTGWRARLATTAERVGGWFDASAGSTTAKPPRATAGQSLSLRRKLARAGVVALAAALALACGLGGLTSAQNGLQSIWNATRGATHPAPTIGAPNYALRRLPPQAQNQPSVSLAPAIVASSVAYLCWTNLSSQHPKGVVMAYRTSDGGQNWDALNIPTVTGVGCQVATDQTGGADVLLLIGQGDAANPCQTSLLLLSRDAGATWKSVPWPSLAAPVLCGAQVTLASGAIYAWTAYSHTSLILANLPAETAGMIIVTRDDGRTWRAADAGLGLAAQLTVIGFRPGGRLLGWIPDTRGNPEQARLVASADYGATWRDLGDIPGAFPTIYISTDPSVVSDGGWGKLYAIARPMAHGTVGPPTSFLIETGAPGSRWKTLPAPPLNGASANASDNLPTIISIGPAGSLFVERGSISSDDHSLVSPARWVWVWSPSHKTWLQDTQPFPANILLFGWNWNHGAQTFWLTALKLDVPPRLLLFTRVYTAAGVQ